jgi:hypothetical protein
MSRMDFPRSVSRRTASSLSAGVRPSRRTGGGPRDGAFDRDLVDLLVEALRRRMRSGKLGEPRGVALGRNAVLAGASAWTFVGDELAVIEDLAAPNTSGLLPIDCAGQAGQPSRAPGTQSLRELQVGRRFREPQVGIVDLARQVEGEMHVCGLGGLGVARSSTGAAPPASRRGTVRTEPVGGDGRLAHRVA